MPSSQFVLLLAAAATFLAMGYAEQSCGGLMGKSLLRARGDDQEDEAGNTVLAVSPSSVECTQKYSEEHEDCSLKKTAFYL